MRRAPIRWRSPCSGTSPRPASAPPGSSLRGILRHLIVRTTRDDREVGRHARRHAQRQVAAHADPQVPRDRGRAGRFLPEHSRQGRTLHGRPRDDEAGRPQPRARDRRRRVIPRVADGVLSNERRSGQTRSCSSCSMRWAIAEALNVVDLYAGSGLFSIPLARRGHSRHADRGEPPGSARRRRQHPPESPRARPDSACSRRASKRR